MTATTSRVSFGGQISVGWVATKGSDRVVIEGGRLILKCFSTYTFEPGEVVSISQRKPHWFDNGLRLVHTRADYPASITFTCWGGSDKVLAQLAAAGFVIGGDTPAGSTRLFTLTRVLVGAVVLYTIARLLLVMLRR